MATDARKIETPFGPRTEMLWGPMQILGISSYFTQTLNRPNEFGWVHEVVPISVPVGTLAIVPMPNLWYQGFGKMNPEHVDPMDPNASLQWDTSDHNWGLGWVQVSVVDVNEPDESTSPPSQTAELRVEIHLSDENSDDSVFGAVGYTLMFLGKAAGTRGAPISTREIRTADGQERNLMRKRMLG